MGTPFYTHPVALVPVKWCKGFLSYYDILGGTDMHYEKTKFHPIQDTMLTITQQQCIYAMCKNFCTVFTKEEKLRFHRLCLQIAGSNRDALFDYLVTSHGLKDVSKEFGVSVRTLQYYRNEFYNNFDFVHRI